MYHITVFCATKREWHRQCDIQAMLSHNLPTTGVGREIREITEITHIELKCNFSSSWSKFEGGTCPFHHLILQ